MRGLDPLRLIPLVLFLPACVIENHPSPDAAQVIVNVTPDGGTGADAGDAGPEVDAGPITNTMSGTVAGNTMVLNEAMAMDSTQLGQGTTGDIWALLSDTTGMCNRLSNGAAAASASTLSFYLVATDGFGAYKAAEPGNYIISTAQPGANAKLVYAAFATNNATCQQTALVNATDGYVTLVRNGVVDSGATEGRFDFTFPEGHVSGSFTGALCSGPVRNVSFCN